mgnify:CR=1 FL=1
MERDSINDSLIFLKCANYEKSMCNPELMKLVPWASVDNEGEELSLNTVQLNKICNECKQFKIKL